MWRIKTNRPPDVPASRTAKLAVRLVIALMVIIAAILVAGWLIFTNKVDELARSQHGARQLYSQAVTAGASPLTTPPGAPPASKVSAEAGPRGSRGPGPSSAQIEDAVTSYCAVHFECVGAPSRAQVAAAVRAYCRAGACRGAAGRNATGAPGPSGASGASGEPGRPPTNEEISDAVTVYCTSHGDCTGPAGPKGDAGATGPSGAAGRGITSIDCSGLGVDQLVIHYDDGSDQTVPCQPATTTPTPSGAPTS